jgi:nucleoside-diphosphate-sugar epimerase
MLHSLESQKPLPTLEYIMSILLTGAKGFLGGWVARELDARSLKWRPLNVRLHEVGPVDVDGIDTVIHCAAAVPHREMSDKFYWDANTVGTEYLVSQCEHIGVRRFIYLSSMGVKISSPYTRSKLGPEARVMDSDMESLIIRPAHLYGPNEHTRRTFEYLKKRRSRYVIDLGRNLVSICYVRDCAAGVVDAAISSTSGKIFNFVEPEISETQYLRVVRRAIGAKFLIIPVPKFVATMKLGKEIVDQMIAEYRIPGVADWSYVPTPLDVGVKETCELLM